MKRTLVLHLDLADVDESDSATNVTLALLDALGADWFDDDNGNEYIVQWVARWAGEDYLPINLENYA